MSDWFQALPPDLSDFLEIPASRSGEAVLTCGPREIRKLGENHGLFVGGWHVSGMETPDPGLLIETCERMFVETTGPASMTYAVYECFNNQAAEYWRAVLNHSALNKAMRKGNFVFAEMSGMRGQVNALYSGGPQYKRAVNRQADYVPDGAVYFPDRDKAIEFFKKAVEMASVSRDSHAITPDEYGKAMKMAGFDLSGFNRIGAALNDPFFLTSNANIRKRLRALFKRNPVADMSGLTGNKTADDIRTIYHNLIKDYSVDVPRYFTILKDAVLTVANDYPKIDPHTELSNKTWHNNVSGVLGGSSNVTNNHLTAKWAIILSVIAAHNRDLSPAHEAVTAEQLFFWVVYGSPSHLVQAAARKGVTLTTAVLPAYPKLAFDDLSLRKPIIHLLDEYPPHVGDDWEENFTARIR